MRVTTSDGGVTQMEYDSKGNLASVTDPRPLQTRYVYNGFGQVTSMVSPDTGTTTYSYDGAGRLANETRADGRVIYYAWDSLGRRTSRTSNGVTETFTYDEGPYGKGRLTRMNDATGQTNYSYNAFGQLTAQVNNIYGSVYTTTWNYDAIGRLASLGYPTGLTVYYGYDSFGRLSTMNSQGAGGWSVIADSFLYQPVSEQLYAWRFGNQLPRRAMLDADGRLTQLYGGVQHVDYGYNPVNQLTAMSDYGNPAATQTIDYDAVDRVGNV